MPKITKIIILCVAAAAVIAGAVVFVSASTSKKNASEALAAAQPLVEANFDTVTYFQIAQLPPKTEAEFSYDDYDEGTLPCATDVFASYAELSDFVNNTYIPAEAARILALKVGSSPRYFDKNGVLCKTTAPTDTSYDKDFSTYSYYVENVTSKTADIVVTVPLKAGGNTELRLSMIKSGEKWLLQQMAY